MVRFISATLLIALIGACGGSSLPPAKVAETQSAISAAAAVGADANPQAALHLKMARDQLKQAQGLVNDGNDDDARLVLERANADAEVALMITRESVASASARKAEADVQQIGTKN